MNENEIMVNDVNEETEVGYEENSGMTTGGAMLLGAAITAGAYGLVKLGKKIYRKVKKDRKATETTEDGKIIDITDDVKEVSDEE